jgi:hypothetical protein
MQGPNTMTYFRLLQREKEDIEKEIGADLVWDDSPPTTRSIGLYKNDADIRDRKNWPDQHKWLYETLGAFYNSFAKRVKDLEASDYRPEDNMNSRNGT